MTFGERIKYYREKAELSKAQLAEKMHVSAAMIRIYEMGEDAKRPRSNPKYETVKKFADALGVTPSDLDPDRYPVGFGSPDEFEDAWLESGGGRHPSRAGDMAYLRYNADRLNDDGIKKLADHSGKLVKDKKYKK